MPANPETCTGCLHWRDYRGLSNAPEPDFDGRRE